MSIFEVYSRITYRSLMNKTKSELARMVLEYADALEKAVRMLKDAEQAGQGEKAGA